MKDQILWRVDKATGDSAVLEWDQLQRILEDRPRDEDRCPILTF